MNVTAMWATLQQLGRVPSFGRKQKMPYCWKSRTTPQWQGNLAVWRNSKKAEPSFNNDGLIH